MYSFFNFFFFDTIMQLIIIWTFRIKMAYIDMQSAIEMADSHLDVKYWSDNHGVGMSMIWPVFEVRTTEGL